MSRRIGVGGWQLAVGSSGERSPQGVDVNREASTTIIRPQGKWQALNLRELWQCRELLYFLIWRDVKVRYKQTLLGAGWAILQPVMLMVVFTIFFGRLAKMPSGNLPYSLFVYMGVLPWTFFATALSNAGNSVVGSERLITKIYFPRLAIPFAAVGAALVDLAIAFGLLIVLMLWHGIVPGWSMSLVPPMIALMTLLALGIGAILAALNVAYRDFRYVIPFLVQVWMFATPTIYMQTGGSSSGALHALLLLNPMTPLIAGFRAACDGSTMPWMSLGISGAAASAIFLLGCLYFRRVEQSFADVI